MQIIVNTLRFLLKDVIINILYFPIWWYSKGLAKVFKYVIASIKDFAHGLNIGLLFKYLLTPMYGYNDITSRIISLFVRIGHFLVLFFITIVWTIVLFVFLLAWILIPLFVIYNVLLSTGTVTDNYYHYVFDFFKKIY